MEWIGMAAVVIVNTICLTICFIAGARIGQRISEGKEIDIPNPMEMVNEYKEQKEREESEEKYRIMMENIDTYDGTGIGQKDV